MLARGARFVDFLSSAGEWCISLEMSTPSRIVVDHEYRNVATTGIILGRGEFHIIVTTVVLQ